MDSADTGEGLGVHPEGVVAAAVTDSKRSVDDSAEQGLAKRMTMPEDHSRGAVVPSWMSAEGTVTQEYGNITGNGNYAGPNVNPNGTTTTAEGIQVQQHASSHNVAEVDDKFRIKILLDTKLVGRLIGKGGVVAKRHREQCGAALNFTKNGDNFPGTDLRSLMIHGNKEQIYGALDVVFDPYQPGMSDDTNGTPPEFVVDVPHTRQVTIPVKFVGRVIGKAGAQIKSMAAQSGCDMRLASEDMMTPIVGERILTIKGTNPQITAATKLVVDLFEEAQISYASRKNTYEQASAMLGYYQQGSQQQAYGGYNEHYTGGYNLNNQAGYTGYGGFDPSQYGAAPSSASYGQAASQGYTPTGYEPHAAVPGEETIKIEMHIEDSMMGALIGKAGATIEGIKRHSGSTINLSGRGVYVPGTTNRIVTISGTKDACAMAKQYILNQLSTRPGATVQAL